jgi:N6-L-threonylcarbamoyladenine synthase
VLTQAKKLGTIWKRARPIWPPAPRRPSSTCWSSKTLTALKDTGMRRVVVAGGVGANKLLRAQLNAACAKRQIRVHYPELHLCTDNGAMIAMAAAMRLQAGREQAEKTYAFDVKPRWPLDSLK